MANIGILGGTFNPPHLAHIRLGEEIAKKLSFEKILLVPNFSPPHKNDDTLAPALDRLNMCRIAVCENPLFEVCDTEIRRGGKSYSYDTLKILTQENPQDNFFFIIGSDMLFSFDRWYRYEDILKMCTVCAAARKSEDDFEQLEEKARKLSAVRAGSVIIFDIDVFEISSTTVREALLNGADASSFLNEKVYEYIKDRGLYSDGTNK